MNGSVNESNGTCNALETENGFVTCSGHGKTSFLNGNDSYKMCIYSNQNLVILHLISMIKTRPIQI